MPNSIIRKINNNEIITLEILNERFVNSIFPIGVFFSVNETSLTCDCNMVCDHNCSSVSCCDVIASCDCNIHCDSVCGVFKPCKIATPL